MANVLNQEEKYCQLGTELDTTFCDLEAMGQILPSARRFFSSPSFSHQNLSVEGP